MLRGRLGAVDATQRRAPNVRRVGDVDRAITMRDPTYRTTPKAGTQRTKTPPANPSVTRSIKGPSWKLLFRVTNSSSRIIIAAQQGNEGLVQKLLQRGANVNSKDGQGRRRFEGRVRRHAAVAGCWGGARGRGEAAARDGQGRRSTRRAGTAARRCRGLLRRGMRPW
jgi:hypothetical protein